VFKPLFSEGIAWMALLLITSIITVGELAHRAGRSLIYNDQTLQETITDDKDCDHHSEEKTIKRSINES